MGRIVRALRRRRRLRQVDLATLARVSQSQISLIERGHVDGVPLSTLVRVAKVLDARVEYELRWRGGALDRLLDERHAALAAAVATVLRNSQWEVAFEVTYSRFRDAGAIDVLAWRSDARALLIVEVKSEITSIEETLRKLDEKVRVAPVVARERFGWRPLVVGRLLVLPGTTRARTSFVPGGAMAIALPASNRPVRRWLRTPLGPLQGRLLLRFDRRSSLPGPDRIRRRPRAATTSSRVTV